MLRRTRRFCLLHADTPQRRSRLREAGEDFGPWKSPADVMDQVERRTAVMGVGPKLIVQREFDRDELSIREVEAEPTGPDLGCAPELERIHYACWDEFSDLRSGGRYVCRFIDGTSSVSRHGYITNAWKGAAEDIFVTVPNTIAHLIEVAQFIVTGTLAGSLHADHVIVGNRIWTVGSGWTGYGGAYHAHVHVDVDGGWVCK
jgi:hypothetical protein